MSTGRQIRARWSSLFIFLLPLIAAGEARLPADRYDALHIVVAADAPEPEQVAARRFAEHWRLGTGSAPDVSSQPSADGVNVWIGSAAQRAFPREFEKRHPTAEGGFILSLPSDAKPGRRDLLIAGGGPRGTLYAEWFFFEKFMGARVFAPEVMRFPQPKHGIPRIDYTFEPPFAYRDTNYRVFLENPWLASMNTLNGQWSNLPDRLGGHVGFVHGLPGFGHTFHTFVSPDEFFDAHPEYFAEINGERVKYSQLCLTNPDVLAITIDRARKFLRSAAPNERILSISQMDYFWFDSWCTCSKCREVDDAEGSHSGTIIRFVNAVADAIKPEFPDALIDTFAYLYSRKPPKLTRPRDNVLVRACAIEADYGRPLADRRSPDNRAFVQDLEDWRRIAKNLWVWDYTQNWHAFQAPHPNIPVLQPNLALFKRIGVDGVFEQASPFSPHSDFELLKSYLIGRGLRDPRFNWKKESAAFISAYYGGAAPYIAEYQDLLQRRLRDSGRPLHFVNDLDWLDADTVERSQAIFARAFAEIHDETLVQRLRSAYLPVQYAALICPPRVAQAPDAYIFTRPTSQTLEEYFATATSLGVTHLNDYPIDALKTRMNGQTPPRYEVAKIEKLKNERFELWIVPALGGAIVRWRELATGRDWLAGYNDIRSTAGRLQLWATTSDDRWAEPEPIDEPCKVVERTPDSIVVGSELENGLHVQKKIALMGDRLETQVRVSNPTAQSITPKIAYVASLDARREGMPSVWMDGAKAPNQSKRISGTGIALRFPSGARTFSAEIVGAQAGNSIEYILERSDRAIHLICNFDRAPMAPGETRTVTLRHAISAARPHSHLPAARP